MRAYRVQPKDPELNVYEPALPCHHVIQQGKDLVGPVVRAGIEIDVTHSLKMLRDRTACVEKFCHCLASNPKETWRNRVRKCVGVVEYGPGLFTDQSTRAQDGWKVMFGEFLAVEMLVLDLVSIVMSQSLPHDLKIH